MRNVFIIIFGPTAIGKTEFAELLARQLPAEIINADLGQFYTPLSIGTAKPQWQTSPIAQHLFDIINEPHSITVTDYRDRVMGTLHDIWLRNNIPIIVGGSGYYIESLFFPPRTSTAVASKIDEIWQDHGGWHQLYAIDPERALHIHPNDTYRIGRALAIWYATGKKPSEQRPHYTPPGSFYFVYLKRDKHELEQRIQIRTAHVLSNGWINEVARLCNTDWEQFLCTKKLIGYNDILSYLQGVQTPEAYAALLKIIITKTSQYSKRQITFGKRLHRHLEDTIVQCSDMRSKCLSYNLTSGSFELYISQLLDLIKADRLDNTLGN